MKHPGFQLADKRVTQALENPFATAGSRLGGEVDDKLKEFFRLPDAAKDGK